MSLGSGEPERRVFIVASRLQGAAVAFLVPRADAPSDDVLTADIIAAVRDDLGAVAALKTAYIVPQLPKTRSGKILRGIRIRT